MYTEQDKKQIARRIRKYSVILAVTAAIVIAFFVLGIQKRYEPLVYAAGIALVCDICFMWVEYLWPCIRYYIFLKDMQTGLTRERKCRIVEISAEEDLQDGVRVFPVRVYLEDEQDERIVYLNVDKTDGFPKNGDEVQLSCFGRHIKAVAAL